MFANLDLNVLISNLVLAILVFLVMAYGNQYVTEFVKAVSRWMLGRVRWLGPLVNSKYFGYVTAIALAYVLAFNFQVDVVSFFETFDGLDPILVDFINLVIVAMGSNAVNDGLIKNPLLSGVAAGAE